MSDITPLPKPNPLPGIPGTDIGVGDGWGPNTEENYSFGDAMNIAGVDNTQSDPKKRDAKEKLSELSQVMDAVGAIGGTKSAMGALGGTMAVLGAKGEDWASIGAKLKGLL